MSCLCDWHLRQASENRRLRAWRLPASGVARAVSGRFHFTFLTARVVGVEKTPARVAAWPKIAPRPATVFPRSGQRGHGDASEAALP